VEKRRWRGGGGGGVKGLGGKNGKVSREGMVGESIGIWLKKLKKGKVD